MWYVVPSHNNAAVVLAFNAARKVVWLHHVANALVTAVKADNKDARVAWVEFCDQLVSAKNHVKMRQSVTK
jgi:hypothetical protein